MHEERIAGTAEIGDHFCREAPDLLNPLFLLALEPPQLGELIAAGFLGERCGARKMVAKNRGAAAIRFIGRCRFNFCDPAFDLGISFFGIQATQRQISFLLNVARETELALFRVTFAPPNGLVVNKIKRFP